MRRTHKPDLTLDHQLTPNTTLSITYAWEDTSFDHAFGTKYQGHYEVVSIELDGYEIDLDVFNPDWLTRLEEKVTDEHG